MSTASPIEQKPVAHRRRRLHEIVFESDTRAGRTFDFVLLWAVILSILVVMLESVASIRRDYGYVPRGERAAPPRATSPTRCTAGAAATRCSDQKPICM